MLFNNALVGGLFLAGFTSAKSSTHGALFRRSNDMEDVLRRDAAMLATLTERQDANGAASAPQISTTPASGTNPTNADLAKWEEQTKAACTTALMSLNGQASNPSGIAVCYNLPFLDNQTGIFQAELRMYNVSVPIAPWAGIKATDINMSLSYLGATVQNEDAPAKRELSYPPIKKRGNEGIFVTRQATNAPEELKVLRYVGKVNANLMGSAMTQATLQPLLIPMIKLSAKNPSGEEESATLSSQEASFVNGVFAKQKDASQISQAQAEASASAAASPPFVIPGTGIGEVGPVGVIVTGVWMVLFAGVVGMGTFGRMQFRDQYRRRMKNEAARGVRTI